MIYSYPIFKEGERLTASDLNVMLEEILRKSKLYTAPPLNIQDGPGGTTLVFDDNQWWGVVCGAFPGIPDGYAVFEVVPNTGGTWQLLPSGRNGVAYEANKNSGVPQGKISRIYPGFSGEYVFDCYATEINIPISCSSASSGGSGSSGSSGSGSSGSSGCCFTPAYQWVLINEECIGGVVRHTWGNIITGEATYFNPYTLTQCVDCTPCSSSSGSSGNYTPPVLLSATIDPDGMTLTTHWNQFVTSAGNNPTIPGFVINYFSGNGTNVIQYTITPTVAAGPNKMANFPQFVVENAVGQPNAVFNNFTVVNNSTQPGGSSSSGGGGSSSSGGGVPPGQGACCCNDNGLGQPCCLGVMTEGECTVAAGVVCVNAGGAFTWHEGVDCGACPRDCE